MKISRSPRVTDRRGVARSDATGLNREGALDAVSDGTGDKVLRYEQFAARPDDGSPWDGVAMQEFASWDDFLAMLSGDAGAIMRADEGQFLDSSGISVVFTGDRVTMIRRDGSSAPGE